MTSSIQSPGLLTTTTPTVAVRPGQVLTTQEAMAALQNSTLKVVPLSAYLSNPIPAGSDSVQVFSDPTVVDNSPGTATSGGADPASGTGISYGSTLSQWVMNNPTLAIGIALLAGWGIYKMFKQKR